MFMGSQRYGLRACKVQRLSNFVQTVASRPLIIRHKKYGLTFVAFSSELFIIPDFFESWREHLAVFLLARKYLIYLCNKERVLSYI